eukprot:6202301-Pleurochrysis_carterae.AAC.1
MLWQSIGASYSHTGSLCGCSLSGHCPGRNSSGARLSKQGLPVYIMYQVLLLWTCKLEGGEFP